MRPPDTGVSVYEIRVRGTVQGVGFRPTVHRLAKALGLRGEILNNGDGVVVRLAADQATCEQFMATIRSEAPPLARVGSIEIEAVKADFDFDAFRIVPSAYTEVHTGVSPDAATCTACRDEIFDPFARRFRYPFANCTHCGPRFSILRALPYDRRQTTMAPFQMCRDCLEEYEAEYDRRFHAQPIACHACGPRAQLVRTDGSAVSYEQHSMLDDVDAVASLISKGEIVAIKALGGFHLACDATNERVVSRLRKRKHRDAKPFALMARDLDVIRRYCELSEVEREQLEDPAAPIVLLERLPSCDLPDAIAPRLRRLGFMLPSTPLHHLILRRLEKPVVMTSGNLSDEPQVIANEDVTGRLAAVADYALVHDRQIANRIDDSVVRVIVERPQMLRRARGYAPRAIRLPPGFEHASDVTAYGGELKATFCLLRDGEAILSPHQGDLEEAQTFDDYVHNLDLLRELHQHQERLRVVDMHPEYLSRKLALEHSARDEVPCREVQHHHAHIASCLVDNEIAAAAPPVLGIALDGLGMGDDGTLWGGEFLHCDYSTYRRVATFKPVPMLGGAQAVRHPWRNTYAHLMAEIGWPRLVMDFGDLELVSFFERQPRATLDAMVEQSLNAPLASSCARLFDAVAGAVGVCREGVSFEGQAAMQLEALVDPTVVDEPLPPDGSQDLYPFAVPNLGGSGLPYLEPIAMWQALLGDLILGTEPALIATRFHRGLARGLARVATRVAPAARTPRVALSGGCFQNAILQVLTRRELEACGFEVLTHSRIPANDGGLALGQIAIAAYELGDRTCA